MGGIISLLLFGSIVVVLFIIITLKRMLYVVPPNQAMVLSGRRRKVNGRIIGYRVVSGGRAFRVPLIESVDYVDLRNMSIDVEVKGAFSKGGIPLNIKAVANVKIPSEEPMIDNAVERFLGRSPAEIMYIAKETLEGNLRGVLAQLTPEQVNEDKNQFTQVLTDEAEHDLAKLGIKLDQLKIQNVTDDVGYLNSIGRIRGASLREKAVIAETHAQTDAAVKKATNWQEAEVARYDADISVAKQDTHKRILDAQGKRNAMIATAQGEVRSQIAKIKAEIDRQRARAVQVKRKLEADVVQPADAQRLQAEEKARADAATIIERGKAEASALHAIIESYRKGGAAAKQLMVLQNLLPMIDAISGSANPIRIGKLTVLPTGGEGDLARKVIGTNEQIRAATGVDLKNVAAGLAGRSGR